MEQQHWFVAFAALVGSGLSQLLPPLFSGISKLLATKREQARRDEQSAIVGYQQLAASLQSQLSAVWLKLGTLEKEHEECARTNAELAGKNRELSDRVEALAAENTELRERLAKLEAQMELA